MTAVDEQNLVAQLADVVDGLRLEQVRGYRLETVAKLLDLPYRTVVKLMHSGAFGGHTQVGRYYVVAHAGLKRYLDEVAAGQRLPETNSKS